MGILTVIMEVEEMDNCGQEEKISFESEMTDIVQNMQNVEQESHYDI